MIVDLSEYRRRKQVERDLELQELDPAWREWWRYLKMVLQGKERRTSEQEHV